VVLLVDDVIHTVSVNQQILLQQNRTHETNPPERSDGTCTSFGSVYGFKMIARINMEYLTEQIVDVSCK
jgi:hypothetical protein